ncbi:MAG TPA: AbrB/MazE/SpoVT family DNA-binding domain-containing protein [Thermoanaerobaculia bacterium]|nr:AbrB/MazE/SpoVT family DNA-binding domain-containing protein [Thermoanaerobaculia bacterium]
MVKEVTLRRMGGSLGATLPKEMVERLGVRAGEKLFAIETEKGVLLTAYDPRFSAAVEVYEEGNRRYRNALRELAK